MWDRKFPNITEGRGAVGPTLVDVLPTVNYFSKTKQTNTKRSTITLKKMAGVFFLIEFLES
jgi:hypothetical protein